LKEVHLINMMGKAENERTKKEVEELVKSQIINDIRYKETERTANIMREIFEISPKIYMTVYNDKF